MKTLFLTLSPASIGLASAIGSALLFAIRPVMVKLIYAEGVDPDSLILLRMYFSLPFFLLILVSALRARFKLLPPGEALLDTSMVLKIFLTGICGYYAASYLDLVGLQYISAQLARVILYIYPTLVVIGTAIYYQRWPSLQTVVSLALAYIGVLLMFGHELSEFGSDVIKGSVYIVLCAFFFAAYLVGSKPLIQRVGSPLYTSMALIGASGAITVHYLIIGLATGDLLAITGFSARAYWLCLAIAVFSTVIPSILTAYAIHAIGAGAASIASMIGPVFTSLFAVTLLGESFTLYHAVGIGLIVTGIAVLDRRQEAGQIKRRITEDPD